MKGLKGLILAIGMGIAAGLFNFMYLAGKSDNVSFIGIADGKDLARGETIEASHLTRVDIPSHSVGNLKDFALTYDVIGSVCGEPATRALPGGSLLLRDDLRTPVAQFSLEDDEQMKHIPIDTQSVVTSLLDPGDQIWITVPSASMRQTPTLAQPAPVVRTDSPESEPAPQMLGPFTILTLGPRKSSYEVHLANKLPMQQENSIGVAVKVVDNRFQGVGADLVRLLEATGGQPLAITWRPHEADQ